MVETGNAELGGSLPLYGHLQLRGLLGIVEIRALHQPALGRRLLERQPLLVELAVIGALQHELHRRGGAASEPRLEGADHHVGDAGEATAQGAANSVAVSSRTAQSLSWMMAMPV